MIDPGVWRFRSYEDLCRYIESISASQLILHTFLELRVRRQSGDEEDINRLSIDLTPLGIKVSDIKEDIVQRHDHWESYPFYLSTRARMELWNVYRWSFHCINEARHMPGNFDAITGEPAFKGLDWDRSYVCTHAANIDYFRPLFAWTPRQ